VIYDAHAASFPLPVTAGEKLVRESTGAPEKSNKKTVPREQAFGVIILLLSVDQLLAI